MDCNLFFAYFLRTFIYLKKNVGLSLDKIKVGSKYIVI